MEEERQTAPSSPPCGSPQDEELAVVDEEAPERRNTDTTHTSTRNRSESSVFQDVNFLEDLEDQLETAPPRRSPLSQSRKHYHSQESLGSESLPSKADYFGSTKRIPHSNCGTSITSSGSTAKRKRRKSSSSRPEEQREKTIVVHVVPGYMKVAVLLSLIFGIAGILVGIVALVMANNASNVNANLMTTSQPCSETNSDGECITDDNGEPSSLLEIIYNRGYVNCGLSVEQVGFVAPNGKTVEETGEPIYVGFDVDLCRAIAAAIFDGNADAYKPHIVSDRDQGWTQLNATEIDVLFRTTRTMEQEVYEPRISTGGVQFGTPYFYNGVGLAGLEEFLDCAESGIVNGSCAEVKICVLDQEGSKDILMDELLGATDDTFVVVDTESTFYASFPGACNVLAGDQFAIAKATLRAYGHEDDEYTVGTSMYSRKPYSMATRRGDPRWTDFLEAVLAALIFAEEEGLSRVTFENMPTTTLFGTQFERMFQNAVSAGGSYGELYVGNLEAVVPRGGMNRLNLGDTPRIWSFPFGDLTKAGPNLEATSPTVKAIKARGFLGCGQGTVLGLSEFDSVARDFKGFQVDLCRALSAALFDGVDHTVFTTFFFPRRYDVVNQGPVDVLFSTSNNLQRNTFVPELDQGMSFSATYHYLGITFGGIPLFVDCAVRLDTFSPQCQSLRVCVRAGTATVKRFSELVRDDYLVPLSSFPDMYRALGDGRCNTILAGAIQIQEPLVRAKGYGYDGPYALANTFFSTENLAVGTKDDDPVWSAFVAWVVNALIYAEENNIDQASAALMPQTNLWGTLRNNAFYHAVNMAGNYGEIYERNFGSRLPRRGRHFLNDNSAPRIYSHPGVRV